MRKAVDEELKSQRKKNKISIIDLENNNRPKVKKINNIEPVDTFIHLGARISSKGGSSKEIKRRIAIVLSLLRYCGHDQTYQSMENIGKAITNPLTPK